MQTKHAEAVVLINQLKGLRNEVERINPDEAEKPGRHGSGISVFIEPYNILLERSKDLLSSNRQLLQSIEHLGPQREVNEMHDSRYHKEAKHGMLIGITHLLSSLESYYGVGVSVPSMKVTKEGVYFGGEYFDALMAATDIFSQALEKIILIDGYVDEQTLNLLTKKQKGVKVQILTNRRSVSQAFEAAARAFNNQYKGLEVKTSDEFHDRFVIIDDTDFYHFGASIKDLGRRSFMFSRIEEPEIVDKLRDKFTDEWSRASVI